MKRGPLIAEYRLFLSDSLMPIPPMAAASWRACSPAAITASIVNRFNLNQVPISIHRNTVFLIGRLDNRLLARFMDLSPPSPWNNVNPGLPDRSPREAKGIEWSARKCQADSALIF
jgi:hypothetical protein